MAADLPVMVLDSFRRAEAEGWAPRRLVVVVDLPDAPAGSNACVVDVTHHLNFKDVVADPGVLGAVAQFAVRMFDA